jgi:hypothetical protein
VSNRREIGRTRYSLPANTRFAFHFAKSCRCRNGMALACFEQTKNTVILLAEDERCWPVVPPLFAAVSRHATFAARRARVHSLAMHRLCNGSRFSGFNRVPVTAYWNRSGDRIVRGAARGSFSLAFLIPHHSTRGSLYLPCQVLVPVIAIGYCVVIRTLRNARTDVKGEWCHRDRTHRSRYGDSSTNSSVRSTSAVRRAPSLGSAARCRW